MEIITDTNKLRQVSETVPPDEAKEIIEIILDSWTENAIGLAAPQLGLFLRVFIADLSVGKIAFINPTITFYSPDRVPSIESCLSLPGIKRCVERHQNIKIEGHFFNTFTNEYVDKEEFSFRGLDAIIVQHEYDHLLGKLIIDLPETKTREQRLKERANQKARKKELKKRVKN